MLYSIKDGEDLENLEELVSLRNQVKVVRLQDKLSKQNFHEDMKKVFELVTKSLENTSQDIKKTIKETSIKNNQAIENLNNKLLEIMNDRVILASYLMSPLSKITIPENSTQFKLVKDHNSNRVNDLLLKNNIPFNLYGNILTFRDTGKEFELKGDLLKMITNYYYNVNHASLSDKKIMYDFAKEMHFDEKHVGDKSTRDRTLINLLKSLGLMVSASGVSKTVFLSSDLDEFINRLKLLLQEKQAGKISDIINDEIVAMVDKLLEYKCISKKQHKQILIKCNLIYLKVYLQYKYSYYCTNLLKTVLKDILVCILDFFIHKCLN